MFQNKKFIILFLILSVFSFFTFADNIKIDLSFDINKVEIESYKGYYRISYQDPSIYSLAEEGDPDIPAYMVRVLIPRDSKIIDIIPNERERVLLGELIPYPFQGYEILSKPRNHIVPPNKNIYESGDIYPDMKIRSRSIGNTRGFDILYFAYYPFEFDTSNNMLYMYQDITFTIEYKQIKNPDSIDFRPNQIFNDIVLSSVENPEGMKKFYPHKLDTTKKAGDIDMLIITTDALSEATQAYADFRESAGIISNIKTVSEINSSYTGANIQLKIKNCIYQYVQNNNITYVFLIGDAGTNTTYSVPTQKLYGYLPWSWWNTESDNTIPGDIFYTGFSGAFDWNSNNNSRVGEMNDNADISPDVIIGRLSVRNSQQVLDYLDKVSNYLSARNHPNFAENLLLSGVQLFSYTGDAKAKTERMYNQHILPFWSDHNKHTLYDSDTSVTVSSLTNALQQDMNFFHMATHGSVTSYAMSAGQAFNSNHALALENIPGILITIACTTNAFDPDYQSAYDPCLGEAFTRNPDGGSIVYIGASRYGIGYNTYDSHGPSFQYNNWIFRYTLQNTYQNIIGAGFTQAKIQMTGAANSDHFMRWIHFCLNNLGDPSITVHKEVSHGIPVFRFFNTLTGGHLYTISEVERDNVELLDDWDYEGTVFEVYNSPMEGTTAVYRLFSTTTGIHLYTVSKHERDTVDELPEWNYEGISFYVYTDETPHTTPMFRFFNHIRGGHLYTISEHEKDDVMELPDWTYEGTPFHVLPLSGN